MPSIIYDASNPLPLSNELNGFDLAVIDLDVTSNGEWAIKATGTDHILIRKNRTVIGAQDGLQLLGTSGTVTNEGTIQSLSETGTAISFLAGGAHIVNNTGTVKSAGMVISGNVGSERIINTGTLQTTSNAAGAVLLDLKEGNDFYDGSLGKALGGIIKLGGGNDTAFGGAEAERFSGGTGDDFIFGGGGSDTVDYSEATARVIVDLSKTSAQNIGGGQGIDTLIEIENAIGGAMDDNLIGSSAHNLLQGGDGNDELSGGSGNDMLEGGNGNDTLDGGQGDDKLDGADGINTARYAGSGGATIDLRIAGPQNTGSYGMDTLIGIVNLEGGSSADHFIGNDANNRLDGKGGNNTFVGGKGNDTIIGGSGQNTAIFSGSSTDYTITRVDSDTVTIVDKMGVARDGTDTLVDVRLVKFADKTIALTNRAPSYVYMSGASVTEGKEAGFVLGSVYSSDPDGDALTYALVSDAGGMFGVRKGSNGTEIYLQKELDYEQAAEHTIEIMVTDAYGGTLTESFRILVRNVVETTPLVLKGTSKSETLTGESGNDMLSGMSGSDQLFGNIGNDKLNGGNGSDLLSGGQGRDTFVFDHKPNVRTNLDTIQDFKPKDDVIHLSKKIFSKIAKGTLSSKAFVVGDQFKDKDDRILYSKKLGAIFYDPDGNGSAKAVQIASVTKKLAITHKDFFIF